MGNNLLCCFGSGQQCVFCVLGVYECTLVCCTHTHHPHFSVTWKTIWLWGINIFGRQKWRQPNKEKSLCNESRLIQFHPFSPHFLLAVQFKLLWKGFSFTLINLLVQGVVSLPSGGITWCCLIFTSYSTITRFAWEASNSFSHFHGSNLTCHPCRLSCG